MSLITFSIVAKTNSLSNVIEIKETYCLRSQRTCGKWYTKVLSSLVIFSCGKAIEEISRPQSTNESTGVVSKYVCSCDSPHLLY